MTIVGTRSYRDREPGHGLTCTALRPVPSAKDLGIVIPG